MNITARARFVRFSPSKIRRVLDLIRGLPVEDARHVLQFTQRRAADPIAKTLESAVASARHNEGLDSEELFVAEAFADDGPTHPP